MNIFVTFKTPIKFIQHGLVQVSKFCFCESMKSQGKGFILTSSEDDFFEVPFDKIESVTSCKN